MDYDFIVIGSGMGGLACASLLTQLENKKVLVLKRHFTPGGYTHMFSRNQVYEWDVGVHYVGEMYPGSFYRQLFDDVTGGTIEWRKMPKVFERFVYPNFTFDLQVGLDGFIRNLIDRFPQEKNAIEQYRKDLAKAARWFGRLMVSKVVPDRLQPFWDIFIRLGSKMALMSTRSYLDHRFNDCRLKAVIASQWGDIGIPPGASAFAAHALVVVHYCGGGYYPIGGAKVIANSVIPIIERTGGRLLTRHRVDSVIVEGKRAVGVQVLTRAGGQDQVKRYYADAIISNAGAYTTFNRLMPPEVKLSCQSILDRFPVGSAHVCLYIGFKDNPSKLGFNGENLWIYNGYDHDEVFANRCRIVEGEISGCFLSFPSLKDPTAKGHTAELISFADYHQFSAWSERKWKKRGMEYDALKQRISEALISFVDSRYPGFADLIEYRELSTPLTTTDFTGHRHGCIYGLPATPEKFSAKWLKPKTPIKNLYLTGSDVADHGIVGALMGGVMTTLAVSQKRWAMLKWLASAKKR